MASKQSSTLTPIRSNRENEERSKSVIKVRERYNRSIVDEIKASMAIDGYSLNGDTIKPRAMSQLKTYNNYGSTSNSPSKLELTSLLNKKTNGGT